MNNKLNVGDHVRLDCAPDSKALARLKQKLAGRLGEVIQEVSAFEAPDMPYEYKVKFPKEGRKAEVELDLHFSILIKAQS